MLEFIKKYDRSIVFIITLFIGLISYFQAIKSTIKTVDDHTPKIERLEKFDIVQIEINRVFEKKLDKMDDKLDRLLSRR